jgi:hypothetical protein
MAAARLGELTPGDFEPHSGQGFQLAAASGGLELTLVEVKRLGTALRPGGAFSLLFVAPAGPFLPQDTYRLTHPKLGTLDVFLVPIGPTQGGNGYQAVFT